MQRCLKFAMQIEIKTNKNVWFFGIVCKVVGFWLSEKVFCLYINQEEMQRNKGLKFKPNGMSLKIVFVFYSARLCKFCYYSA